jgi:hypothetical protein
VATQTLRPATLLDSAGGWFNNGGAASLPAALADDNDTTAARLPATSIPNSYFRVGLTALSALPALAQIRYVSVRARVVETPPAGDSFFCQVFTSNAYGQAGVGPGGGVSQMPGPNMTAVTTNVTVGTLPNNPSGASWQAADLAGTSILIAYTSPPSAPGAASAQTADVFELYVDVSYNQAPTFSITSAATFATSRPTFTGTYSDPEGDGQERIWVKVFTAAQVTAWGGTPAPDTTTPFLDLGERYSGTPSVTAASDIPDGSYWLYAKVADVGSSGRYSAYATQSFIVATAGPAVPTITATADPTNARNIISVQGSTNMETQNQADVETNTTGFVAITNNTITRSTTVAANGLASLRMSSTAAGTMTAGTLSGLSGVLVRANAVHTAFAKIRAGASARTCRLGLNFYDLSGTQIGTTTWSAAATDSTSAWTTFTLTTTTPVNAVYAQRVFEVQSTGGAAELHYVDMGGLWPTSSTAWTRGGLPFGSAQSYIVESSDDGGTTWQPIRGSPFLLLLPYSVWVNSPAIDAYYQTASFFDYEAQAGVARIYRARTSAPNELGVTVTSAASGSTSPLIFSPANWILKDPITPTNSMLRVILQFGKEALEERMGIFYALGRPRPITTADAISGWNGDMTLVSTTAAAMASIEQLLRVQNPLLLQSANNEHRYIRMTARGRERRGGAYYRHYPCTFVEVDPP